MGDGGACRREEMERGLSVVGWWEEEGLTLAESPPSPETGTESIPGAEMIHSMVERIRPQRWREPVALSSVTNRNCFYCYTQVLRRGRGMQLS
jgi:hypothetical protein